MTSENPKNPITPQQSTVDAHRETDEHSAEAQPPITQAATKPETQIPPQLYEVTCNTKRDWIDKTTLGFEAFGLVVLIVYTIATIVYACITNNMWKEMQQQTTAIKGQYNLARMAVSEQEARLVFHYVAVPIAGPPVEIHFDVQNIGNSNASTFLVARRAAFLQNAPSKTELQFQEEDRFPVNTVIVPQSMAASTKKTSVLSIAAKETDSPKLTKPGLDDFFAGRNRLYIWGEIQFSSERIGPHEPFVFCDYILVKDVLPNGTLQYHLCREGNPN